MQLRRYIIIWISLFLPTVAIGILAITLLTREQNRLDQLAATSAQAQAQTVADNAVLIFAEIQTGVAEALQAASGEGNESTRLAQLTRTNPFIQATYISDPSSPDAQSYASPEAPELQTLFNLNQAPWQQLGQNINASEALPAPPAEPQITQDEVLQKARPSAADQESALELGASGNYANTRSQRATIRKFSQQNAQSLNELKAQELLAEELAVADASELFVAQAHTPNSPAKPTRINRKGWLTTQTPSPQWLAWHQTHANGRITAALLDSTTVRQQLTNAFPTQTRTQLTYTFEPPNTNTSGLSNTSTTHRIPLSTELAGWHLRYQTTTDSTTPNLSLIGSLLVTFLCLTSLGSGASILWRARKDARESAQKSTFVSNVSHELRTPLTTIRMYAEILQEGRLKDPKKQTNYLSTITNESQRLTRLVDNILDFSHLEQKRKKYQKSTFDLNQHIQSIITNQQPRLTTAAIQVHWQPYPQKTELTTDPDAIEQVLLNLIDNAIKYAHSGKTLKISLHTDTPKLQIHVADNGPGIPQNKRHKIFQAFERLDQSLTNEQPGSGLGLSISQNILRDLGGDLYLDNHNTNGACFIIELPKNDPNHST